MLMFVVTLPCLNTSKEYCIIDKSSSSRRMTRAPPIWELMASRVVLTKEILVDFLSAIQKKVYPFTCRTTQFHLLSTNRNKASHQDMISGQLRLSFRPLGDFSGSLLKTHIYSYLWLYMPTLLVIMKALICIIACLTEYSGNILEVT